MTTKSRNDREGYYAGQNPSVAVHNGNDRELRLKKIGRLHWRTKSKFLSLRDGRKDAASYSAYFVQPVDFVLVEGEK